MADVELKQSFRDHSEMTKYSQELLQFISSDDVQQSAKTSAETLDKLRSKLAGSEQTNQENVEALKLKKSQLKAVIDEVYSKAMPGDHGQSANIGSLKQEITSVQKQIKSREKEVLKLKNEKRIIEFHKKHRKLQRKVANVQFDMSSTEQHVKGYLTKAGTNGGVQTFEFNLQEDSPCYVCDFLWDCV